MSIQSLAQTFSLPPDLVLELKSAFSLFDEDGDGTIEIDELMRIFDALDMEVKPDRAELRAMVAEVDADGNEELDFDEFLQLMSSQMSHGPDVDDVEHIKSVFKKYNTSNSGFMTSNELRRAIEKLCGLYLSKKDVTSMIRMAAPDGEGKLNEAQFVNAIQSLGEYQKWVNSKK